MKLKDKLDPIINDKLLIEIPIIIGVAIVIFVITAHWLLLLIK